MLLECLTGYREYPGPAVEAAVARLLRDPVIPDTLPSPWPGLLRSMTSPQPDARPTAAVVATTLAGDDPQGGTVPPGDRDTLQGHTKLAMPATVAMPTTRRRPPALSRSAGQDNHSRH